MNDAYECTARNGGIGCTDPPVITEPIPLCSVHRMEVVVSALPQLLASAMDQATALTASGDVQVDRSAVVVLPLRLPSHHMPIVYFLRNGDRIKIGHTRGLAARLRGLAQPRSSVVLALVGDVVLERALHTRFEMFREPRTEWFVADRALLDFVQERGLNGVRIPLTAPSAPLVVHKVSTPDARKIFNDRLDQLRDAGVDHLHFSQFKDIPATTGRSRPWVYLRLDELVAEGVLRKEGTTYRIVR